MLAFWPLTQLIVRLMLPGEADDGDQLFACLFGAIAAVMWPFVLAGLLAWRISRWIWSRLLGRTDPAGDGRAGVVSRSGDDDR